MKENNDPITDMQRLAEAGWKQMHQTLIEKGLSTEVPARADSFTKRNFWLLAAACLLIVFILSFPSRLDHPFSDSLNAGNTMFASSSLVPQIGSLKVNTTVTVKGKHQQIGVPDAAALHQKILRDFSRLHEKSLPVLENQRQLLSLKVFSRNCCNPAFGATDKPIDTFIHITKTILQNKAVSRPKRPVQMFAGIGFNFSLADKRAGSLKEVNVHPAISFIIPLHKKVSLHTGLWALSTIHGKEVTASERQLLNNVTSNMYYNIHNTSIIKASYIDLPVTINYSICKNLSAGGGLQLSRLYKVNIREEKENFDYNNTLYSASIAQYNSTPTRAVAIFQKKATIKKYETRFIAEALFWRNNFLLSAGYYYGLGKTITVKNTDGSIQQYRNEYFKFGVQYKVNW